MAVPDARPSTKGSTPPSAHPLGTRAQVGLGICVLLLGAGLLIAGVAGMFLIHTNGMGRLLGCGIVLSLALLVHGWTLLTGKQSG